MEKIKVELSKLATPSEILQDEKLPTTGLPKTWVVAIFEKFQARYSHKWTTAIEGIEEVAVNEWSEYLHGLTGDDIKHGINNWDNDWPPSAPEFRKACKQFAAPCHREFAPDKILESDELKARRKKLANKFFKDALA